MARRNANKPVVQSDTTEAPAEVENTTEENPVTEVTTEAPVEADATTEAPVEAPVKAPVAEADFGPFQSAVDAALEGKDSATGEVAPAFIAPVQEAFRGLDGAKNKNKAKAILNEGMKSAMNSMDIQTARAYMTLSEAVAQPAAHVKAERVPADPTEAFIQRVVGLRLATDLATETVPEGVKENWRDLANELFTANVEAAKADLAWTLNEAEDKGDEPEAAAFVKAAVKLSQGKSGKIGGKVAKGTGTPFTGERRDIGKHILEAFASKEVGDFLTVSEIRNSRSDEYGDNPPSAGAISARLFPKSGKCTLEGVVPATSTDGKGNKGATKA